MTDEQRGSLKDKLEPGDYMWISVDDVIHLNVTFEAESWKALEQIRMLCKKHLGSKDYRHIVLGVFPAHIAAAVVQQWHGPDSLENIQFWDRVCLGIPVAIPAPAKEGEIRGGGFVHSHWEFFETLERRIQD